MRIYLKEDLPSHCLSNKFKHAIYGKNLIIICIRLNNISTMQLIIDIDIIKVF